ncbi:MAG: hypothetical protein QM831_41080 [Kofleriaceae bacterium]
MSDAWDFFLQGQVNQLRRELHDTEAQVDDLGKLETATARSLRDMRKRLLETSTLLLALVETLAADGKLDLDVLQARHENMLADQPPSADHPEPTTADKPYTCTQCFRATAIASGNMTATGFKCNQCARW